MNPCSGTRCFKAPELLIDDRSYNYAVDMWAVGCTFGGWLFNITTLFRGNNNQSQLDSIVKLRGSYALLKYMVRNNVKAPQKMNIPPVEQQDFTSLINENNSETVNDEALDLLGKMLCMDKDERITPKHALEHEYFWPVRAIQDSWRGK